MFLTYLRREPRRRIWQATFISLGLALGIAAFVLALGTVIRIVGG